MANELAIDILKFLKKVSEEYHLPPEQRAEAAELYRRAGEPIVPQQHPNGMRQVAWNSIPTNTRVEVVLNGASWSISRETYAEINEFLRTGNPIQAIKALRQETRCGLKEGKDMIEQAEAFNEARKVWKATRGY